MTTRNLEAVFAPRNVAVIGASQREGSLGHIITRNLRSGGFDGGVFAVNPKYRSLLGEPVYSRVGKLRESVDLAVIVTPPRTIPRIIEELAEHGARGACVISAGLSAHGEGAALRKKMLQAARGKLLRIVGPNCLGIQVPALGLDASFAHLMPSAGSIAFIAQSGAMITSVLDWARPRDIGFSLIASLGDMADVDFGDMLDYLANDRTTRSILLYVEAVTEARKFMSAARAAARTKPVIVVKSGRHEAAARAARSHTGAMAGSDAVYDAAFRRAGMLRVFSLEDLFDAVETLSSARPPRGDRLAILTNGGGIGIMATDALADEGAELAQLSPQCVSRLDSVLPPTWSRANPVDIVGDADGARYAAALEVLLSDVDVDAVLTLNCPTAIASSVDAARAVIGAAERAPEKTLLTSWVGEMHAKPSRELLAGHGVATYQTPEDAARAFAHMVRYRRNQRMLIETPPSMPELFEADVAAARACIEHALARGDDWLSEDEAKRVIDAYGITTVPTFRADAPEQVVRIASEIAGPVAIKIVSPALTHKSDVGGVALNVEPHTAGACAEAMLSHVAELRPDAIVHGFNVQPMVVRPHAVELILGMVNDPQFGPVLLFGHGGTAVELFEDKALGLPPLNLKLAHELIACTRVHRLLQGYRNVPAADLDAVALVLVRLSQLVVDIAEIQELDVNPLIANSQGTIALDARIRIARTDSSGPDRLAIRPYPKALAATLQLRDGGSLWLRPIVPEDEEPLQQGFARLTAQEVRYRFFVPIKLINHVTAARSTQIDYDREMALVLTTQGVPGHCPIHGVVRLVEDPDRETAEFAIIIERSMTGQGLGKLLMQRIIAYAQRRGVGRLIGDVLAENTKMRGLCESLGFTVARDPDDFSVVRVTLELDRVTDER